MPCAERSTVPGSRVVVIRAPPSALRRGRSSTKRVHGTDSADPQVGQPSDLPVAAAEHRNALAAGGDPVHVDVVRADHEVDVLAALVDARHDVLVDEELEA